MASLTSLVPPLAPLFGLTPAALYERQRALVKLHILPTPIGRGRGSGAEATPENVAKLVLAVMATDNLSDLDSRRLNKLMSVRSHELCKLTGNERFLGALEAIFASEELASRVLRIGVFRSDLVGQIQFLVRKKSTTKTLPTAQTNFGEMVEFPDRLDVEAKLWGPVVERIEMTLRSATTEDTK